MDDLCRFPDLPEKYDRALREAVSFIVERFRPVGIIASGTIVRGTPDASSDLDIWVIHMEPVRQRIQKFFNRVPAEIFLNPPSVVRKYFVDEQAAARPMAAHMIATGAVIMASDPVVDELRNRAISILGEVPPMGFQTLTQTKYAAATVLEDAADIIGRDPGASSMLLSDAVLRMLRYAFMKNGKSIPRDKDLLSAFEALDPQTSSHARRFFDVADAAERLRLAHAIADRVLEVRGFFEWSSEPEPMPPPPPV